jgi:hypothetical protein
MQRIALVLTCLALPGAAFGQGTAGTDLWRVAATTLPLPPALARGGAAAFWNPAQTDREARSVLVFEAIETPAAIGASGFIAVARVRAGGVGTIGAMYARMEIGDLVRTTFSPDPDPASIPFFTEVLGATWAREFGEGGTTVGATLAYHQTQLDNTRDDRFTVDLGARRALGRLRLAAATHFFTKLSVNEPAQEIYAGLEVEMWRGPLWTSGPPAAVLSRYGVTVARGYGADHLLGAGLEVGQVFAADVMVAREGSYGFPGWRPVAGVRVLVGKYRVSFARDGGVSGIGSAFRVGLEARLP